MTTDVVEPAARAQAAVIALARTLIEAMRSRRRGTLAAALRDLNAQGAAGGSFGGSRHYLARKHAAEEELATRGAESWQALRRACEAAALPYSDMLAGLLKGELREQLAVDKRSLEAQITPPAAAAAFGYDLPPMDLADAAERVLTQIEPEIDLFLTALMNGVSSGYAYGADPRATVMAMPQKSAGTPLVFISYSHDSDEHKQWVRCLAEQLVANGIDVILDQWHLKHGRDLALFMERGIAAADFVLMVCTEAYVAKANERAGGVGYESLFLTGELPSKVDSEKLIPVVRQTCQPRRRPAFVTSRLFADLSSESTYESDLEELLRTLHNAPRFQPPPRGTNPFARSAEAGPITVPVRAPSTTAPLLDLPALPFEIYQLGKRTIAAGDIAAWNQLREKALTASRQALFNWRGTAGTRLPPRDESGAQNWTFELISTHAPVIALTCAAASSGTDRFMNQTPVIDRLIRPDDWEGNGPTVIVESPQSIAWAAHLLVGAVLVYIGRLDFALALARSPVHLSSKPQLIVETHALTGWPPTLDNSEAAWRFIMGLRNNWPWLETLFGDKQSYRAMLTAYLLALSITEFAERLRRGELFANRTDAVELWVPLWFVSEEAPIQQRAYQAIVSQQAAINGLFPSEGSFRRTASSQWTHWLAVCSKAGRSTHRESITQLTRYADLVPTVLRA